MEASPPTESTALIAGEGGGRHGHSRLKTPPRGVRHRRHPRAASTTPGPPLAAARVEGWGQDREVDGGREAGSEPEL